MVCGVPVGSPAYVFYKLKERAGAITADARRIAEVLRSNREALWSALPLSISQRFGYLHRAGRQGAGRGAVGDPGSGLRAQDTLQALPAAELDSRSFQEWAVRLPVRLHGWGLRSLEAPWRRPFKTGSARRQIKWETWQLICDDLCQDMGG